MYNLYFKITQPVIIGGDYVRPICLPQGETVPNDMHCVAAGWGTSKISQQMSRNTRNQIQYLIVLTRHIGIKPHIELF